jgi:predicted Zn-dependent peptidase
MVRFSFDLDMKKVSVPETDLLYDILLSGYNSKLFIEMSEKRGLFYDTSGAVERYKNIGNFYFSFEVKEKDIYEATELVVNLLHEMKNTAIPEGECMQAGYVDNAYMLYDDSRELNFTFAYDNHVMELGYGSLEDRRRAYADVTAEDLMRAAKEIFRKENLILTVKGNKKRIDTARLKEILKTI